MLSLLVWTFMPLSQNETVHAATYSPQVLKEAHPAFTSAPAGPTSQIGRNGAPYTPAVNLPYAVHTPNVGPATLSPTEKLFFGDDPPQNADWSTYEYPDDYKFYYGDVGAGNIGNGLCTEKNKNRTQVTRGYCAMLSQILNDQGSCAHRAMEQILAEAGPSGNGIGDLPQYCSTFGQIGDKPAKTNVFLQVLSTLITQESGWNSHATEKQWYKNGQPMGGRGLFQIGVTDRSKDPDCYSINSESIYDPKTNMKCGACIALTYLAQDRTMGHGTGDYGARGMARYFGPLRDMQVRKRLAMAGAVNEYCVASTNGTAESRGLASTTAEPASQSNR
jgi:hypothetical protein